MKRIYEYEDLQPVIDKLLQDKESSEIEFKSAAGGFPKSFWETYSSFANMDGGTHLLESSGRGRGTKYHVYGLKVGLPDANVGLKVGLPDANVGLNVGLPDANVGLSESQKKRYTQSELRALIIDFCSIWRTADEISHKVGRNIVYIRDRVLPQMSDVIEKKYDIPHHPKQKYRTKQKDTEA